MEKFSASNSEFKAKFGEAFVKVTNLGHEQGNLESIDVIALNFESEGFAGHKDADVI